MRKDVCEEAEQAARLTANLTAVNLCLPGSAVEILKEWNVTGKKKVLKRWLHFCCHQMFLFIETRQVN